MSVSTRWCFTLNNYDEDSTTAISKWDTKYTVFGKELSASGTPHLQGFVIFKKSYRLSGTRKLLPTAHWEIAKGTSHEASDYCKKDNDFVEIGVLLSAGKRTDLSDFMRTVESGTFAKDELRRLHPGVMARYPRFVDDYINQCRPSPAVPAHPLRPWQQNLISKLAFPPSDRLISFVVDPVGNAGKSWFGKYYCSLHENAFMMRPTKYSDMAFALPDDLRVFFLDCTRQQVEHLPYSFLESLKDGMVFSPKYESRMKKYPAVHVVVFTNTHPDMTLLSADRYDVIQL